MNDLTILSYKLLLTV